MKSIRLTAAATSTIPRKVLVILTAIYGFVGVFARDPWKNDDAFGFGVMWTLAHGQWHDWLLPHLAGREEVVSGPLTYWLGALSIKLLGSLLGPTNAAGIFTALCFFTVCTAIWHACYLLGRRREVQPQTLALGGQPESKDYGRTIADGALLIFLACVGLAMKSHETTSAMPQLVGQTVVLYGMVRSLDKPIQGGIWSGIGLFITALTAPLWLCFALLLGMIISLGLVKKPHQANYWLPTLSLGLLGAILWPTLLAMTIEPTTYSLREILFRNENYQPLPSSTSLSFLAKNFALFAWPVWPLAFWSLWFWRKRQGRELAGFNHPHLALPLGIFTVSIIYLICHRSLSELPLVLMIAPMVIWAAFSLPTIKRSIISFIDWLAIVSFTILGLIIWLMWLGMMTNVPAGLAKDVAKRAPGFIPEFSIWALLAAIAVTAMWVAIVKWRTSRAPKVIWRAVVISASGTTLTWVLLMTLWLPAVNYAKTYRWVAARLESATADYRGCIDTTNVGDGQLASFIYFTKLNLKDDSSCDLWLTHTPRAAEANALLLNQTLTLLWEDRRASDPLERLRLYRVSHNAQ